MNYEELVSKADVALGDLSSGGLLAPEQSDRFFRKVIDIPTIFQQARVIQMARPKMEINKIGFSNRVLKVANQGAITSPQAGESSGTRALAIADRTAPAFSKITLDTKELIAEIDIPYEVLEANIEGGQIDGTQFQATVLDMLAQCVARDLEEKIILGDTTNAGDPYLALQNGIIAAATSNIVNHNGAAVSATLFKNMINALPKRYRRFLNDMKFFTSPTRETDYRLTVANRQTNLGDAVLTGSAPVSVLGVGLQGASQMPDANAILMNPKNLIVGIQRQIRMEWERDIRERAIVVVFTLTVDHQFEEEDMVVKAIGLGS